MILALLQARMSSSRLPGKVMLPILGYPVLQLEIERILRSKLIDKLVVVTSTNEDDACIAQLCDALRVECYRGSLHHVLDRFYQAATFYSPQYVVRLTGDCPVIDPEIIDEVIQYHLDNHYDYTSNTLIPTYPDGLDVEVFQYTCLKEAWMCATSSFEYEHVTPYIRKSNKNKLGHYANKRNDSHLRWTLDQIEDYILIKKIFENLYNKNNFFGYHDILDFLEENPSLKEVNTMHSVDRV